MPHRIHRVKPADSLQGIRGNEGLGVEAAARQRLILDAGRYGLEKQLGGFVGSHPGKAAALGGLHQVGEIYPTVVPRRFFGGIHQSGRQIAVRLYAEIGGKDAAHRVPMFRTERPEMHILPAASGLRVRHIEHIFQAHATTGLI
ncbi:MAG: hypothetical protein ABF449_04120 [Ethanoligenens sp.]